MDQDDPEERIAELERRLAEHQRFAEPKSTLDPGGTPSDRGAAGNVVEERGTHQLKGVPGEWHLSVVTSSYPRLSSASG